ncbi:MAG: hypothetical protein GC162_15225 [Planctomycetes bacterium]|nr:hypothetical protein [Planctomycetota bacterium]
MVNAHRLSVATALVAMLLIGGCHHDPAPGAGGKPVVVTTIWPLASLVRQMVGEKMEVVCLVPAGVSPHGFEPTAADADALSRATLLVNVGMGFDTWAERSLAATGGKDAKHVSLAELAGIDDRALTGHAHHHQDGDADDDDEDHESLAANPHLWLDPVLIEKALPGLAAKLGVPLDEKLAADVAAVDEEYKTALAKFPGAGIVTFHNAFDRLAARYGLKVVVTLSPVDAPGAMTPRRLEMALKAINDKRVQAVFAEPQFPPDVADVIARETGIRIHTLDPIGNPNSTIADTWQHLMRYNLRTLVDALSGP